MIDDALTTKVEPEINPYKKLGKKFDPFGVANIFNLPFCLAEAFKKLACAGIDGRTKTAERDVKEAIYSIKRAIEYFNDGDLFFKDEKKSTQFEKIDVVKKKYNEILGLSIENSIEFRCAIYILIFSIDRDDMSLNAAIRLLSTKYDTN